jgi:hypothetical protein
MSSFGGNAGLRGIMLGSCDRCPQVRSYILVSTRSKSLQSSDSRVIIAYIIKICHPLVPVFPIDFHPAFTHSVKYKFSIDIAKL